jgi:hypothetical protein
VIGICLVSEHSFHVDLSIQHYNNCESRVSEQTIDNCMEDDSFGIVGKLDDFPCDLGI